MKANEPIEDTYSIRESADTVADELLGLLNQRARVAEYWSQDVAGQNVLAESETAIASPPATWVGPHSTYNLRVKLPRKASAMYLL